MTRTEASAQWLASRLAPWFAEAAREMTWRRTRDPWAIWVSEIMLQQTRVDTVERYYADFMARFPDVGTMAAADESDVLAAWSGLGYYRRARLLHRGARYVATELGGEVPSDHDALRAIPGVGPYTAGAIGSIAFDQPIPLVDGNVARVLSRLFAIDDPKDQAATAKHHWTRVAEILRAGQPRVLAQALMELGATVCTPRNPTCEACPVRARCRARAEGSTDRIPAVKVRKASPVDRWIAVSVTWRGKRLFVRRPGTGLLAGLWCLPLLPAGDDAAAIVRAAFGDDVHLDGEVVGRVRHVFTHRVWELDVVAARSRRKVSAGGDVEAWSEDVPEGGIPKLTRKLLGVL